MRSAGTRLGHPENPEEVSLNSVADNGGKRREGRSPRQEGGPQPAAGARTATWRPDVAMSKGCCHS